MRAGEEPESPFPTREWLIWAAAKVDALESKWDPEDGPFDALNELLILVSGDDPEVLKAWWPRLLGYREDPAHD